MKFLEVSILAIIFVVLSSSVVAGQESATLIKAFAFGSDSFTRPVPNKPSENYIKVVQNGDNFKYSSNNGHGYIDTVGIDNSPNNRQVLDGDDEIYDQFIGVKGNGDEIIFRVDVPDGQYRFIAAGGDAQFGNHTTTLKVRDGTNGQELILVGQQALPSNTFYRVGFDNKAPPLGDGLGVQPNFLSLQQSPLLTVTTGYIEVIQIADHADVGGDLCIIEFWIIRQENQPPIVVEPLQDFAITVGDDSFEKDLNDVFEDPDGDELVFSASSSNDNIVNAILSGTLLMIAPVAEGTAQIILSANDNVNPDVTHSFSVTVLPGSNTLIDANFDHGSGAFRYRDDVFRGTNEPNYASGRWIPDGGFDGGALQVMVGGLDNLDIRGMSGGWRHPFSLAVATQATLSFRYKLTQSAPYEEDEYSEVLVTVDDIQPGTGGNDYVIRITGDGNAGDPQTTGWQLFGVDLGPLAAGRHALTIGGFNNKKTFVDEFTEIFIDDVKVMVETKNEPPILVEPIPDDTLTLGAENLVIDLDKVFEDPDGDDLTFSAHSSDDEIATVNLSGSILTVSTIAEGSVEITVTASDQINPEIAHTFQITVEKKNAPPFVANAISDTTLIVGVHTLEKNLTEVFSDPDEDELLFSASSSIEEIATAEIDGDVLIVSPVSEGATDVTITASDKKNPEVAHVFKVKVARVNQQPVVIKPIPHTTLIVNGPGFEEDLNNIFRDPDEDELIYAASSSNDNIAMAQLTGSILTISAIAEGDITVTVEVSDNINPIITYTFAVTVEKENQPPVVLTAIPDTTLVVGGPAFETDLMDVFNDPDGEKLLFSAGSSNEGMATVTLVGSVLKVFPAAAGNTMIAVRADDPNGGADSTKFSLTVQPYPNTFTVNATINYASRGNASLFADKEYRIVGLPGSINSAVTQFLQGEHNTDWQVYWDNGQPENYFIEFDGSATFQFLLGRAFWIINKGPLTISTTVPTEPLNETNETEIPLHAGFNLITNPFMISLSWSVIQQVNEITEPIWSYNGSFLQSSTFEPLAGYYFFNGNNLESLRIPVSVTPPSASEKGATDLIWQGRIIVVSDGVSQQSAAIGVALNARDGLDRFDYHKPRAVAGSTNIYFRRIEWDSQYPIFASDIRPLFYEFESWEFEVSAQRRQNSRLLFDSAEQIPANFAIYLIEENKGESVNLEENSIYRFTPRSEITPFRVIVGKENIIAEKLKSILPREFIIEDNYPNPFNPSTNIPVSIPKRTEMQLKIYNILGQEVKTVYSGHIEAGRYLFNWDGKDRFDNPVSSGVYIYQLIASEKILFRGKMILLK